MSKEKVYKLKNGETIKVRENNNIPENIIKSRKELDDKETQAHIIRALIVANKPQRCSEIAKACNMSRTRIFQNLPTMIKNGLIFLIDVNGTPYYVPQKIFWNNDIIYGMYERMLPFVEEILEDLYLEQMEADEPNAILECIQMAMKLFSFEIDKMKKKSC